jgi:hypothetical protein
LASDLRHTAGHGILPLSLVLPARAIGDRTVGFKKAWSSTRCNTWRMIGGSAAFIFLPALLLRIVERTAFRSSIMISPTGELTVPIVWITTAFSLTNVVNLLTIPLGAGFLSHAYQHFFQRVPRPVE